MKAGVVGAGLMGAEIALVFALAGHDVLLHDRSGDALERAVERLRGILDKGVSRKFYDAGEAKAALERIEPVDSLAEMAKCAMVTEAVYESLDAKVDVLRALDEACAPGWPNRALSLYPSIIASGRLVSLRIPNSVKSRLTAFPVTTG